MREEVEARTLSFDAAVEEFIRCATGGASGRAERLLALHPGIASATSTDGARARRRGCGRGAVAHASGAGDAARWTAEAGNRCSTCATPACTATRHRAKTAWSRSRDGFARIGANPNAEYHWNWHPELPRTALWASICAVGTPAAGASTARSGANPTDGVSVHIAGGVGNIAALELLHRFGVNVNGIPGGVPPLVYMMFWSTNPAGPRWLLEHGADPNLAWGNDGESPLHVAARRWDVPMVELLVQHGADPLRRRVDGCTAAHARGAAWQSRHRGVGCLPMARRTNCPRSSDSSPLARAETARTRTRWLAAHPELRAELRPEHHLMLQRPAESGNAPVLETMLSCGFDPNAKDKDNVTALHRAAMGGHSEAVRVLLKFGADVNAMDGMFSATPLVWAVEGRGHAGPGADHVAVARLLIAAGSPVEWKPPEGAPHAEHTQESLIELRRAATDEQDVGCVPRLRCSARVNVVGRCFKCQLSRCAACAME